MKKYSIFAVLFVLLPFLAQGASTVDPTIPKAPYASSGSCTTGYNYKDGYCRWSLDPAPIRNNFAAAYNDITALQANSLTNATPITIGGDCSGVGVYSGISISCSPFLRGSNNLSDIANAATARTNLGSGTIGDQLFTASTATGARSVLGLGTAATQNATAFLQPSNNLSDIGAASTARTNLGLGALAVKSVADLSTDTTGVLPVNKGGTGTATPGIVAGTNITVSGTWPNQTINSTASGGSNTTARGYVLAANSHGIPGLSGSTPNWVINNWKWHVAPTGADFTCIKAKFVNWQVGTNSEQQGSFDFTLRAGLIYNNKAYRFTFGGQTDYDLKRTWGSNEVWSDPICGVTIKGGDGFYITTRTVADDAGAAGTYALMFNSGGRNSRRDGIMYSTDPTVDYTMGVGVCYGHTYNPATVNGSGNVTGANLVLSGIGCTAGLNIDIYCGGAGCNTPGAVSPGTGAGAGGYCTNTGNNGGQVATVFLNGQQGNDYSSVNPPIIGCGGTGTAATGFGTNTALYTASVVAGIPSKPISSILLFGDSNVTGFAAVDGLGNINGSEGMFQQWLDKTAGTTKIASVGTSCVGFAQNKVRQEAFMTDLVNNGVRITDVINEMGSNDFLGAVGGSILSQVTACNQARNTFFKTLGAKVWQTTISPQVTSAGSKVDVSAMVPYNANYNLNGIVTQYNTSVNALGIGNDAAIDTSIIASNPDPSYANLPRVDAFAPASKSCTTTSGSNVITIADTSGLYPTATMGVQGTGIPANTTITTVTRNTSITVSQNATASGTVTCNFTTAFVAGDGVHWSVAAGIPYLVKNLPIPTFTVP